MPFVDKGKGEKPRPERGGGDKKETPASEAPAPPESVVTGKSEAPSASTRPQKREEPRRPSFEYSSVAGAASWWPLGIWGIVGLALLLVASFVVPRVVYAMTSMTDEWQVAYEDSDFDALDSISRDWEGAILLPSLAMMVAGVVCCLIGEWRWGLRNVGEGTVGKALAVLGLWFVFACGGAVWFYNWAERTLSDSDYPMVFLAAWSIFAIVGGLFVSGYICLMMFWRKPA